jgi:hypothetical protein
MGLDSDNQIAPTGEGSVIEPGTLYSERPNTYRGTGASISRSFTEPQIQPASGTIGHNSAGPVGASPTKPNPYRQGVPQGKPGKRVSKGKK